MRKLAISLLTLLVLLLIIFLGLPFIFGVIIQQQYPSIVKGMSNPPAFTAKLVSYQRGWFTSSAKVRITVTTDWLKIHGQPNFNNAKTSFILHEKISQGPYIFSKANGKTMLKFAKALVISQSNTANVNINANTTWTFADKINTRLNSSYFILGANSQKLSFKNISGNIHYQPDAQKVKINLTIQHGLFTQPSEAQSKNGSDHSLRLVEITGLQSQANFQYINSLWYGSRQISIDKIKLTNGNNTATDIDGLKIIAHQNKQKDTTNINLNYSMQHFSGDHLQFGPMELSLSLLKLNSASLSEILDASSKIEQQQMANTAALTLLYQPTLNLIGNGFQIRLNKFFINTDNGSINATANVLVPKQTGNPNFNFLMKHVSAIASLQLPQAWLENILAQRFSNHQAKADPQSNQQLTPTQHAQQQINNWLKNNWLQQNGDFLSMKLNYNNGKLIINGKPFEWNKPQTPSIPEVHSTSHQKASGTKNK